jgi:hypothetical protein
MHSNEESSEAFKALTQSVIANNNDAAHVHMVEELQVMVEACVNFFELFPNLLIEYPDQCQVIIQFGEFKKNLPEEFCTLND